MERTSTRVVYENAWMSVREDRLVRDDGSPGLYGVVDRPDPALVIPRDDAGLWLVEQYRYPVARRAWEFPQGTWSGPATGSPEELARAELAEETGLTAGRLRHLGRLFPAYGLLAQAFDVWLAEDLVVGEPRREATEQDMVSAHVTEQEFRAMVRRGDVADACSLAAYALWRLDG